MPNLCRFHAPALGLALAAGLAAASFAQQDAAPAPDAPAPEAPAPDTPAPDPGVIAVDLNRVDQADAACRLTFTVRNGTQADLDALVYEIVLFDKAEGVAAMTLFDFGALPRDRLRARQFDIAGTACADLGGILVNGVASCSAGGAAAETCLAATRLSSRTEVEVLQ